MASLAQLLRGGSLVPDGAGGFKLQISSKFKWDTEKLHRKLGEANAKALQRVGMDVRKIVQKGMSSRDVLGSKAETVEKKVARMKKWRIGSRHGVNLVALVDKVPKPDVVTSWKTPRNPKGYLRQSIQTDYSHRSESVVVGPAADRMSPRLNVLLEKGGTTTHYFVPYGRQPPGIKRRKRNTIYGRLQNSRPRVTGRRIEQVGLFSFTRTVRGRGFMAKGLQKALPKIPDRWRNSVRGP
jgi:hypothetical protein